VTVKRAICSTNYLKMSDAATSAVNILKAYTGIEFHVKKWLMGYFVTIVFNELKKSGCYENAKRIPHYTRLDELYRKEGFKVF